MAIGLLIDVMRTAYAIRFYIAAEKKSSKSLIPNTPQVSRVYRRLEESGNVSVVVDVDSAGCRYCRKSR